MAGNHAEFARTVLENTGVRYIAGSIAVGRRAESRGIRQEGPTLMAILVGRETRVIVQGLTGRAATFHVGRMLDYGTRIVGGVTPGKGGSRHLDLPVFDTVAEASARPAPTPAWCSCRRPARARP